MKRREDAGVMVAPDSPKSPNAKPKLQSQLSAYVVVILMVALVIVFGLSRIHSGGDPEPKDVGNIRSGGAGANVVPITVPPITTTVKPSAKKKIAYAITVTKDGHFLDGALVLGHSAQRVHRPRKAFPEPGISSDEYDVELVAFVTAQVQYARPVLAAYGWRVIEKGLPVGLDEIQNQNYANNMKDSGCCGADEFLKLWAYTLTEYHRVVHLDMDSIVYKNMDELYSIDKELLYTGDWNMRGHSPVPPVQGGFLVIRPSMERFEELRAIIRKGDHTSNGWGGSKIGNFWGGQTIQGILPYFYYSVHPGDALEVDRCVYNCMVDNPYYPKQEGKCLDGKPTCKDCRLQKQELVSSAHFTICQKPWTCTEHVNPKNKVLCEQLHNKWFALRDELERETHVDLSYRAVTTKFKGSLGMCSRYGDAGYKRVPLKDGLQS